MSHLYEIETDAGVVRIDARSRAHARRIAERMGHTVRSVNMIG